MLGGMDPDTFYIPDMRLSGTVAIGCIPGSRVAEAARSAEQAYIHTEGLMLAASAGALSLELPGLQ
jgi:hypothetical protein